MSGIIFADAIQTSILLAIALVACQMLKRSPGARLVLCRGAIAACLAVLIGFPWVGASPKPLVPVTTLHWTTATSDTPASSQAKPIARTAHVVRPLPAPANPPRPVPWTTLLIAVWEGGVALLALWLLTGYVRLAAMRKRTETVSRGTLFETVWRVSVEMKVQPPVIRCGKEIGTPFVAGISEPSLYVPESWQGEKPPNMLEAILRHEMAHLAAHDLQWQLAYRICTVVFWPQILLWLTIRAAVVAAEELCDQRVLASGCSPQAYAASLLQLKEKMLGARQVAPVGIGAVSVRSAFGKRIEVIMNSTNRIRRELTRPGRWGLLLGCGLIAGLTATLIACPSRPSPAPKAADNSPLPGWYPTIGTDGPSFPITPQMRGQGGDQLFNGFTYGKDRSNSPTVGGSSAFIDMTVEDGQAPYRGISQMVLADKYRGKRIRLSGMMATQAATGAGLQLEAVAKDHIPGYDDMRERAVTGTVGWKHYSVVVDVPADAVAIQIGAWVAGKGKVWVDNFVLEPVDPAKVKTNATPPGIYGGHDPARAVNLDFSSRSSHGLSGWLAEPSGQQEIKVVPNELHDGKPVLDLTGDDAATLQEVKADPFRGKRLRFDAYVKSMGPANGGPMLAIPGGGAWIQTYMDPDSNYAGSQDWKRLSCVVDVPVWATCVQFGLVSKGPGTLWISDCRLDVVDPSAVPLSQPGRSSDYGQENFKGLPGAPVNLGFN